MTKRFSCIDLMKFVFSWVIVIYHMSASAPMHCPGGYCAVDYFLIAAGFFLFTSFERQSATGQLITPGQYFSKRFSRFFPAMLISFLYAFVIRRVVTVEFAGLTALADSFSGDIWELLMLKMGGILQNGSLLNGPDWTVSSILLCGFVIWALMYYLGDRFTQLLMPVLLILGFGCWFHIENADFDAWTGLVTFGTMRAFIDMCLAFYCVRLCKVLSNVTFNTLGKSVLTVIEVIAVLSACVIMFFRGTRYWQWVCMLLFVIGIAVSTSGNSLVNDLLNKAKFTSFLGEFSFSLFLVHVPTLVLFRQFSSFDDWTYIKPVLLLLLIAVSLLHMFMTKLIIKAWRALFPKLKKALTE